jgi:hypothetical protein
LTTAAVAQLANSRAVDLRADAGLTGVLKPPSVKAQLPALVFMVRKLLVSLTAKPRGRKR